MDFILWILWTIIIWNMGCDKMKAMIIKADATFNLLYKNCDNWKTVFNFQILFQFLKIIMIILVTTKTHVYDGTMKQVSFNFSQGYTEFDHICIITDIIDYCCVYYMRFFNRTLWECFWVQPCVHLEDRGMTLDGNNVVKKYYVAFKPKS